MASKGPKSGTPTRAAPKPAARTRKPAAPKAEVVVAEAEKKKPVPKAPVAKRVAPAAVEPAPAPEAASQEVVETSIEPVAPPAPAPETEAVEAVVAPVETIVSEAVEVVEAVVAPVSKESRIMDTNFAKAQNLMTDLNERTKAAMEKSGKMVEELNEFAKGNVEALVESSRITAKGFESLGQEAAEYGRKSFESATAALKSLAAVKSPTDFFKLQSDFVRSAFDSYVAEASKNAEAVLKLAGEASQPISNRFAVAADKVKTAA